MLQKNRRALFIEAHCFNENFDIETHKVLLPHPIAGSFKVTNGKITCKIRISEDGVEVIVRDNKGNVEKWETKKIFAG